MFLENLPIFKFALRDDLINDIQFIPTKAESYSTGFDVRAAQLDRNDLIIKPGEYFRIPLGFRSFCPPGWYYQLHPRSSSFAKKHMHNLIGIIDESWEGETQFAGQYIPSSQSLNPSLVIKFGDPIGQIIPLKRNSIIIESISNEEFDIYCFNRNATRGSGGFGSTG